MPMAEGTGPVIVVASIFPLPEHRQEVIELFERTIEQVQAEDEGCELYALHEGEDRLVMIEKWSDRDTFDQHGRSPALAGLRSGLAGKLGPKGLESSYLSAHPSGSDALGSL
jgi:quinol monooxygenase YgiN